MEEEKRVIAVRKTACRQRNFEDQLEDRYVQDREDVKEDNSRNNLEYHAKSLNCIMLYAIGNPKVLKQRRISLVAVFKVSWNRKNRKGR